MDTTADIRRQALACHRRLPARLWKYLNARGIPDALIHKHLLGWNGKRITIPIFDREGKLAFFKLAKDPEDKADGPKMLTTVGAHAEPYGWERVLAKPEQIIICEGEFDRLVLESRGFAAVTSTGGAATFKSDWAEAFREIPRVYICFDRDEAGRKGALRVGRLIPHAKLVELPEDVGEGGDVTDFFIRLGYSREDFLRLLEIAQPVPPEDNIEPFKREPIHPKPQPHGEVQQLKTLVSIEDLVGRYLPLRQSGQNYIARCPFHEDHDPSFVVYPESQSFYCFGCHAAGDAISFLIRTEHLTFPEAVKVLREIHG